MSEQKMKLSMAKCTQEMFEKVAKAGGVTAEWLIVRLLSVYVLDPAKHDKEFSWNLTGQEIALMKNELVGHEDELTVELNEWLLEYERDREMSQRKKSHL